LTIEIIEDASEWDIFVEESPDKTLFHTWKFLKIVEKHSNYTFLPYGIYEKKNLISLFPLFYQKRMGMRFLFSTPPMSLIPFTGLLMNPNYSQLRQRHKEHRLNTVVSEINAEIDTIAPHYVLISMGFSFQDIRPFLWHGFGMSVGYTYTINLNPTLDSICNSFEGTCRREIRVAEKDNLSLRQMKEIDDIEQFFGILEERYRQQLLNLPLFSPDYIKEILATFPDNIKLYSLFHDKTVVDMILNYEYNNRLTLWMGGVNLDRSIHCNEYLVWEFIKQAKSKGCHTLEIQGADIQRLSLFKSKFNPRLEFNFHIHKKSLLGKCAEWAYMNVVKKRG